MIKCNDNNPLAAMAGMQPRIVEPVETVSYVVRNIILISLAVFAVVAVLLIWASIPIVQFSWSTKQCVAVIGTGSCQDLPQKYVHEWVK